MPTKSKSRSGAKRASKPRAKLPAQSIIEVSADIDFAAARIKERLFSEPPKVDIHVCPKRNAQGFLPCSYIAAVQDAAAHGAPVEANMAAGDKWERVPRPVWDWKHIDYRIASPVVATKGTLNIHECPSRVNGVLPISYMIAVLQAAQAGMVVEVSIDFEDGLWRVDPVPQWAWFGQNYRIAQPAPAAPKMVQLTEADIPATCWIRGKNTGGSSYLVTGISAGGVTLGGRDTGPYYSPYFTELQSNGWEYSTDRIVWKRCEKPAS